MDRALMIPVPVSMMPWGFFDRQRSLFSEMYREMEEEFKTFDKELEKVKNEMFQLEPFHRDHHDQELSAAVAATPNLLHLENPIVTDNEGNKKLSLRFDVSSYKPEEVEVKLNGNVLSVHAKHVEDTPNQKVFKEFSRQCTLPKSVNTAELKSILTKDGVLNVVAPAPEAIEPKPERLISIEKEKE